MEHEAGTLYWTGCTKAQARGVLMRNGISGQLLTHAVNRFNDPSWDGGPHIYLIDTWTDKGARVTVQGPEEFDVKVSSRTGSELLHDLLYVAKYTDPIPVEALDKIIVMD